MSTKKQRNKRRKWAKDCSLRAMMHLAIHSVRPFGKNSAYESLFGVDWGHKPDYTGTITFRADPDSIDREAKPPSYEVRMTSKFIPQMIDWPEIPDIQRQLNETHELIRQRLDQMLAEACAIPADLIGVSRAWTSAEIAEMREADLYRKMVEDLKAKEKRDA